MGYNPAERVIINQIYIRRWSDYVWSYWGLPRPADTAFDSCKLVRGISDKELGTPRPKGIVPA